MARTRTKEKPQQAAKGTKLQLKWFRSTCQAPIKQKLVIKGLGFTRLNQVIEREDTLSIRGTVAKVPHLVQIVGEKLYRDQK
jgi:large subunit ribosomal protein L30